jgi:CBS domain
LNNPSRLPGSTSIFNACGAAFQSQSIWIVDQESHLQEILEPMAKGVHVFLVSSRDLEKDLKVTTQTDVLRFVYSRMQSETVGTVNETGNGTVGTVGTVNEIVNETVNEIVSKLSITIAEFGYSKDIVTVQTTDLLTSVLRVMMDKSLGSVGVVDGNGILVDFFSISDLRVYLYSCLVKESKKREMGLGFYDNIIKRLEGVSVLEYLDAEKSMVEECVGTVEESMLEETVVEESMLKSMRDKPKPGVICLETSTLSDAIEFALVGKGTSRFNL